MPEYLFTAPSLKGGELSIIEEVQLLVRLCAFSSAQFMLQVVIAINSSVKRQKDKKMLILFIPMNVREIRTLCFLSGTQEL